MSISEPYRAINVNHKMSIVEEIKKYLELIDSYIYDKQHRDWDSLMMNPADPNISDQYIRDQVDQFANEFADHMVEMHELLNIPSGGFKYDISKVLSRSMIQDLRLELKSLKSLLDHPLHGNLSKYIFHQYFNVLFDYAVRNRLVK